MFNLTNIPQDKLYMIAIVVAIVVLFVMYYLINMQIKHTVKNELIKIEKKKLKKNKQIQKTRQKQTEEQQEQQQDEQTIYDDTMANNDLDSYAEPFGNGSIAIVENFNDRLQPNNIGQRDLMEL